MAINPHMKVYITHGFFDLVTPYYSSSRISGVMKLDDEMRKKLTVRHYYGGHMFYSYGESRKAFTGDIKEFFSA